MIVEQAIFQNMEPFAQRVVLEYEELMNKIVALNNYKEKDFPGASEIQKTYMTFQLASMRQYAMALKYRIEDLASLVGETN